jgi:hypothetical protein
MNFHPFCRFEILGSGRASCLVDRTACQVDKAGGLICRKIMGRIIKASSKIEAKRFRVGAPMQAVRLYGKEAQHPRNHFVRRFNIRFK